MSKPTRKQVKITAELVKQTCTRLDELGLDYAVVIKGFPQIISNVDKRYAFTILRDHLELQDKLREMEIEYEVDAQADRGRWGKGGEDNDSAKPA